MFGINLNLNLKNQQNKLIAEENELAAKTLSITKPFKLEKIRKELSLISERIEYLNNLEVTPEEAKENQEKFDKYFASCIEESMEYEEGQDDTEKLFDQVEFWSNEKNEITYFKDNRELEA